MIHGFGLFHIHYIAVLRVSIGGMGTAGLSLKRRQWFGTRYARGARPFINFHRGGEKEKTDVTCLMLLALLQREQRLLLRCRQEVLPHLVGPVPHPHLPLLR